MIVRILEDGQYELGDEAAASLERLDAELDRALRDGDEHGFAAALAAVIKEVHARSAKLGPDELTPSDLTVPAAGSSLDEVRRMLSSEQGET